MAGGNLSARQKMINLMYLIFIAMLALNMSKKVLSSFGFMKDKLADSNIKVANANNAVLTNLATKAVEQPEKYNELNQKAQLLSEKSNEFFVYLDSIKAKLIKSEITPWPPFLKPVAAKGAKITSFNK